MQRVLAEEDADQFEESIDDVELQLGILVGGCFALELALGAVSVGEALVVGGQGAPDATFEARFLSHEREDTGE